MILVSRTCGRDVDKAESPLKKEVMKNQEAERGEGTPTDLLSPEIIIEQPAPINEIPEGNDGIWLTSYKKWINMF